MVENRPLRVLLAAALLGTTLAAAEGPSALDKKMSLNLVDAQARDVLSSFGAMLPARVELDPAVSGKLTIQLADVSIRTVLEAVCDMLPCEWTYDDDGTEPTLRVVPATTQVGESPEPGTLETTITMALERAPPRLVFSSFAEILGAELDLEWGETVTIELRDEPLADALDKVCEQLGCEWWFDDDDADRRLIVRESSTGE